MKKTVQGNGLSAAASDKLDSETFQKFYTLAVITASIEATMQHEMVFWLANIFWK